MEIIEEKTREKDKKKPMANHVWHIARALYHSLQASFANQKLKLKLKLFISFMSNLNLNLLVKPLLHSKLIIPKSIDVSSLTCHSMDPATAFYSPREVEFSCSNTPSYNFHSHTRKLRRGPRKPFADPEAVAKAFEILNSQMMASSLDDDDDDDVDDGFSVGEMATPSPMWAGLRSYSNRGSKSSMAVRQLRVTDSPFPIEEEGGKGGVNQVDSEAEEFIKRFYQQLQLQKLQLHQRRVRYEPLVVRQACG